MEFGSDGLSYKMSVKIRAVTHYFCRCFKKNEDLKVSADFDFVHGKF